MKMTRSRIVVVAGALLACVIGAPATIHAQAPDPNRDPEGGAPAAKPGKVIEVPATIVARTAQIRPRTGGVLRQIAKDGARVKAGEILAQVDDRAQRIQVQAAGVEFERAKANLERVRTLVSEKIASPEEFITAQANLKSAEAAFEYRVMEAEATRALAPFDGVVTNCRAVEGEVVNGDVLCTLVEVGSPSAQLQLPESAAVVVRPGHRVRIRVVALGDAAIGGVIESLAPVIDPKSRTRLGRVKLEAPPEQLLPGMHGKAEVVIE